MPARIPNVQLKVLDNVRSMCESTARRSGPIARDDFPFFSFPRNVLATVRVASNISQMNIKKSDSLLIHVQILLYRALAQF